MPSGWAPQVWIDGRIVSSSEARVSVFDRGFQHGDGVYETVRARSGRLFRWPPHRVRLERSLAMARISLPFPMEILEGGIESCLEANTLRDARIRITVTRGEGSPGIEISETHGRAAVVISASPHVPLPPEKYREGVAAIVAGIRQTGSEALDPALKHTSRIHLVLARIEASERGAHEAILLNGRGEVAEGTCSNLFIARGGELATPSLDTGILEGVTRDTVLELARASGRPCREVRLLPRDLRGAEEIFFSNTTWGALPVTRLDGEKVGTGKPGMISLDLGRRLEELVEQECAG